ncbi:MAG: ABC transporter substrate-binding protein [Myxococcales bacterium]
MILRRFAAMLLGALAAAGCTSPVVEGIPIGLLLPRTGHLADSGGHAEAAALLAAERVNLAGGVGGKPVTLVVKDTRSDAAAGREAARKLIDEYQVKGIVGPEEEDVAESLIELARPKKLVQISGGITSVRFTTIDDGGYFFRTCPTTAVTATGLAQRMAEDGMRTCTMLYVPDELGSFFANYASVAYCGAGGAMVSVGVPGPVSVQEGEREYRDTLKGLIALKPESLMLATDPITGVRLVSDWKLLGGTGRIYLAPTLMTDVFVHGVPAGALEGAVGVTGISGDFDGRFAGMYRRSIGNAPAQSAFYYYDAMAVMALALERAWKVAGAEPDGDQIRAALLEVASPPGTKVGWDELATGLEKIRAGEEIDYEGASGSIDFDGYGDVGLKKVGFWSVRASENRPIASPCYAPHPGRLDFARAGILS